jgi:hypothetical protein
MYSPIVAVNSLVAIFMEQAHMFWDLSMANIILLFLFIAVVTMSVK